jgi:hypothetical protein
MQEQCRTDTHRGHEELAQVMQVVEKDGGAVRELLLSTGLEQLRTPLLIRPRQLQAEHMQ